MAALEGGDLLDPLTDVVDAGEGFSGAGDGSFSLCFSSFGGAETKNEIKHFKNTASFTISPATRSVTILPIQHGHHVGSIIERLVL